MPNLASIEIKDLLFLRLPAESLQAYFLIDHGHYVLFSLFGDDATPIANSIVKAAWGDSSSKAFSAHVSKHRIII